MGLRATFLYLVFFLLENLISNHGVTMQAGTGERGVTGGGVT